MAYVSASNGVTSNSAVLPASRAAVVQEHVMHDVIVIGSGPVGLACAIEAQRQGVTVRVLEKGAPLVNSILGYPLKMEFFSTPELIEIGGHPFSVQGYKPTREDALEYYRLVAARETLDVRLYEPVLDVRGARGAFTVITEKNEHRARNVVVAIGFFDRPNRLNAPGEDLPKVTHYYREPFPYARQKVAVIGAKNSAAKAALDCYRHGAEVTLVVRAAALSDSIKYWIRPDLENRIKDGSVRAFFNTSVQEIRDATLLLKSADGPREIANDWVLAMTGYHPDFNLLERLGIALADDPNRTPIFDERTFETARPGYVHRWHGMWRLPYESLVYRKRTFPRASNRDAHHERPSSADSPRRDALEDRRVIRSLIYRAGIFEPGSPFSGDSEKPRRGGDGQYAMNTARSLLEPRCVKLPC